MTPEPVQPMSLHVGFGGKYVSIYSKPLTEANETDRVCRFPRTKETEQLALSMAAAAELLEALQAAHLHFQSDPAYSNGPTGRRVAKAIAKATGTGA